MPTFGRESLGKFESKSPLRYPGHGELDKEWISTLMRRLYVASFHPPELLREHVLGAHDVILIAEKTGEMLKALPNILDAPVAEHSTIHIVGDLHGHLHDLLAILGNFGWPGENCSYVFDGDFVDRGSWGVDTLLVLFVLKIKWSHYVHLIRGDHEGKCMTSKHGFKGEAMCKYDEIVWDKITKALIQCPLGIVVRIFSCSIDEARRSKTAVVSSPVTHLPKDCCAAGAEMLSCESDGASLWKQHPSAGERRILVVHGGLFRVLRLTDPDAQLGLEVFRHPRFSKKRYKLQLGTLHELLDAERGVEHGGYGTVADVLWSDPQLAEDGLKRNVLRNVGLLYGKESAKQFLDMNYLHGMIRAHECPVTREKRPEMGCIDSGHCVDMEFDDGKYVCTVFSASEYPMKAPRNNRCGIISLRGSNGGTLDFASLKAPCRPKYINKFKKGLPFAVKMLGRRAEFFTYFVGDAESSRTEVATKTGN